MPRPRVRTNGCASPSGATRQRPKREVEGARLRHNTALRVAPVGLCPLCLGLPRVWSPLQGCAPRALMGSPPWGFSSLGAGAALSGDCLPPLYLIDTEDRPLWGFSSLGVGADLGGDCLPPLYLIDTEGRPLGASPPLVWVRPWAGIAFRPYTYRYSTSGMQRMHAARDDAGELVGAEAR